MAITTLSAREFNQQVGRAKKCAKDGPVFITDRGVQTHVLLDVEEYRKIAGTRWSLGDLLANDALAEIDLELPEREIQEFRNIDFDDVPAGYDDNLRDAPVPLAEGRSERAGLGEAG